MSPLIAWIPILGPIGSQNPPLDPSDPQTVILDTSTPNPGPLLTLSPCPSPRFRPPCQPTCSGHCTSQWSPAQTRPWSWGSVTQRPRSQCRQRLDCPRSTSGSSSGGTQVRWGAGRKKSGGPRAWGASPHPLTLSLHLRTVQPVLLWRGRGARPGRGARSPRMGQRGCTVPAGRARCTAVGLC